LHQEDVLAEAFGHLHCHHVEPGARGQDIVLLMVTPATEQVSLADAKARLSEVVEGVETEHRRVVITKHGRPSVVVLAVEDLEALEDTLELLSDADAMADLREAAAARRTNQTIELTKEEAQARWSRG
jgi:antitoxin YefM